MRKFSGGNFFYSPRPNALEEDKPLVDNSLTTDLSDEILPSEPPQKLSEKASSYLRMSREHDRIINEMLSKKKGN